MHPSYFLKYRLEVKLGKLQNARQLDQMVAEKPTPNIHLSQHPNSTQVYRAMDVLKNQISMW